MVNGNILGRPNVPAQLASSGIWGISEAYNSKRKNTWPVVINKAIGDPNRKF
jgi:hypothetical protein